VVDEVLAVGDAEFQKKAIGKMQDISKGEGRTVLFVSHNMGAVGDLCKNAVILDNGQIFKEGLVKDIITTYLESSIKVELHRAWGDVNSAPGTKHIKLRKVYSINDEKKAVQYSLTTDKIGIWIEYDILEDVPFFNLGINLYNTIGTHIFSSHDTNKYQEKEVVSIGRYVSIAWIPENLLQEGEYLLSIAAMRYNPFEVIFNEMELLRIQIIDTDVQSAKHENCKLELPGIIRPKLDWHERIKF